jgi:hypothetical protein
MENFTIKIVTDLSEAKFYWDTLVVQKTIFDNWDFRFCFYKYFNYPLQFYVGFVGDEPIGLLPLQYNQDENRLEFFGERFMEDNKVSIKAGFEKFIPEFYANLPDKAKLEYIIGNDEFTENFKVLDYKYFLNLNTLKSGEDYLQTYFDSESRGKLKRKLKKITQEKIQVLENNFSDVEFLIQFKIDRFKESSTFNWPHRKEIFRDILKLPMKIFLNSFLLNGELQGVSLSILYNHDYAFVNFATKQDAFPNFSTFINMYNIEQAIKNGAKNFNAFAGDYGWKELWHLEKSPQYAYYK